MDTPGFELSSLILTSAVPTSRVRVVVGEMGLFNDVKGRSSIVPTPRGSSSKPNINATDRGP